jgi:hypothetical protein
MLCLAAAIVRLLCNLATSLVMPDALAALSFMDKTAQGRRKGGNTWRQRWSSWLRVREHA